MRRGLVFALCLVVPNHPNDLLGPKHVDNLFTIYSFMMQDITLGVAIGSSTQISMFVVNILYWLCNQKKPFWVLFGILFFWVRSDEVFSVVSNKLFSTNYELYVSLYEIPCPFLLNYTSLLTR